MIFNAPTVDPADMVEARRLARRALVTWLVCWILPAALGILFSDSQGGEVAILGAYAVLVFVLACGTVGTAISFRAVIRAWRLDRTSGLVKLVIGLNVLTMLWALRWLFLILSDLVG